ncbi:AraC family transcriptional regulator [Paenibacillus puerhi]|uniref:AraC family transcriptional regulator n=1 Tax=Paenibacillus puerhi TaxID=2692622 RepID=UPI0013572B6A|nr:AraC family transcriptional regulator [Paenibacillus puerhi]
MKIYSVAYQQSVHGSWKVPLSPTKQHIFLLVTKGTVIYRIAGQTLRIRKGEGLFMQQHTMRSSETDLADPHALYSAHFQDLPDEDLACFVDEPFKLIRPLGFDYLKQRFSLLNEYWIGQLHGYELITRGILTEILGIVQRELLSGSHPHSLRSLALRIQEYILKHFREPILINDLARYVDRSPTYVSTVFRRVTGRTPIGYMHEVRIAAARDLLMTTNMTIRELSESLGYCDQTYFNYMYKKIVGYPPSHTLKVRKAESMPRKAGDEQTWI